MTRDGYKRTPSCVHGDDDFCMACRLPHHTTTPKRKETNTVRVIQIDPKHGAFGGCFAIVTEEKSFGVQAVVLVPQHPAPGHAYIRLNFSDYEEIGQAVWGPPDD